MLISNSLLLIFAVAFMGCVLATPVVTRIALWAGAIDRLPSLADQPPGVVRWRG